VASVSEQKTVGLSPRQGLRGRVARWYILKPKNSNFGELLEGLSIRDVGIFYVHLVYFMVICDIIPILVGML
jgi:hypothetical protein